MVEVSNLLLAHEGRGPFDWRAVPESILARRQAGESRRLRPRTRRDCANAEGSAARISVALFQLPAYIFATAACFATNCCAWRSLPRASRAVCSGVSDASCAACAAGLKVTVVEDGAAAGAATARAVFSSGFEAASLAGATGG